ncbi:MAG: hypothetical protein HWE13_00885 [Gammaproteobacteria bacterium]|nr:hypothetical protein [Gammaproteobacteria bacterium]
MSTVEKAFLKSLEGEESKSASDQTEEQQKTEDATVSESSRSNVMTRPSASRKSIANMEKKAPFSIEELEQRRLIHLDMKDKGLLNHYRNLRTKLLAKGKSENFVTMVTSVVPDTSSSLVSANLAATFALDESKTSMLIEADIVERSLNSVFDLNDSNGLIDYLESESDGVNSCMHKTRVPRLGFVPSGKVRECSAEYFTSERMETFIKELVNRYPDRFPIINAPSVLSSADTRILLDLCDQVILVVPYAGCSEEDLIQASSTIGADKLSGLVLNNF